VISLVGILLVTRLIGAANYGTAAAVLGILLYQNIIGLMGLDIPILRRFKGNRRAANQAWWLVMLWGGFITGISLLLVPAFAAWTKIPETAPIAYALLPCLPIALSARIASAVLEQRLQFKSLAWAEITCQLLYQGVAVVAAWQGAGAWAIVAGYWVQQLTSLVLWHRLARYYPKWYWHWGMARVMLREGVRFSFSNWLWQLRGLVSPLIVGRYGGAEAVAFIALAVRLCESLTFPTKAAWRLAMPGFAKVQNNKPAMLAALSEGMRVHLLVLCPIIGVFGLLSPFMIPLVFGQEWGKVVDIFPYIATGYLWFGLFVLHVSALYALGKHGEAAIFHAVHIVLFAGTAWLLVPHYGLVGYGIAELAALLSYAVLALRTHKHIGQPHYALPLAWCMATSSALFYVQLGWWALAPTISVLCLPASWRAVRDAYKAVHL
jgi:O-antigen/teichoic acid export membrane protein